MWYNTIIIFNYNGVLKMELIKKIEILSGAAKYDASCSSSGSNRKNEKGGVGNGAMCGICHSWADDGRCVSLLKILMTNYCMYDCAYCSNRRSNDIERAAFTVDEIVKLTMDFYKRNYIEGLFLSSGVVNNPDHTMEMLINVVRKLRKEEHFFGYIHLKVIPGASQELVRLAGLYADRISVNIELPSEKSLVALAPEKNKADIVKPMSYINHSIEENKTDKKIMKAVPQFAPAGQSTQMIVGASAENDIDIIKLSENLYKHFSMKRVYYSAFVPVNKDNRLPVLKSPPLVRENRLYQADWLMRFYGFKGDEILDSENPFLDMDIDPKSAWAIRNIKNFPVEINKADYETILRIPGIGVISAKRIIQARKFGRLNFEGLKKIGVIMKRAKYFITCDGKYMEHMQYEKSVLKFKMMADSRNKQKVSPLQLKLFDAY